MTHADCEMQEYFFDYFVQLKTLLHNSLDEQWHWRLRTKDENGKTVSRIYNELYGVNIFKQDDWPQIISFLKPRILVLDEFWNNVKDRFEDLR
jgi:hypothetical protein